MNSKNKKKILLFISGIFLGVMTTGLVNETYRTCFNPNHDYEYIRKLERDNIMLDEINKELREVISNENQINAK